MGCCRSSSKAFDYRPGPDSQVTFKLLQLGPEEINILLKAFKACDADKDGRVTARELLDYLKVDYTSVAARLFSVLDENSDGSVDFREFVVAVYNYCAYKTENLTQFAYDLYDSDNKGWINVSDMQQLMRDAYGANWEEKDTAVTVFRRMKEEGKATRFKIDEEQFVAFVKTRPALLFPTFRLHEAMQRRIGGVEFWRQLTEARRKRLAWEDKHGESAKGKKRALKYKEELRQLAKLQEMAHERQAGQKHHFASSRQAQLDPALLNQTEACVDGSVRARRAAKKTAMESWADRKTRWRREKEMARAQKRADRNAAKKAKQEAREAKNREAQARREAKKKKKRPGASRGGAGKAKAPKGMSLTDDGDDEEAKTPPRPREDAAGDEAKKKGGGRKGKKAAKVAAGASEAAEAEAKPSRRRRGESEDQDQAEAEAKPSRRRRGEAESEEQEQPEAKDAKDAKGAKRKKKKQQQPPQPDAGSLPGMPEEPAQPESAKKGKKKKRK